MKVKSKSIGSNRKPSIRTAIARADMIVSIWLLLIFFLEEKIDALLIDYSKESDIAKDEDLDAEEKKELIEAIKEAETKEVVKQDARYQKQVLQEYVASSADVIPFSFFLAARRELACDG